MDLSPRERPHRTADNTLDNDGVRLCVQTITAKLEGKRDED